LPRERATRTRSYFCSARRVAMSAPIPPEAPVTNAVGRVVEELVMPGWYRSADGKDPVMNVEHHVAQVKRDGFTVIEDAIDPALLDTLATDLLHLEETLGVPGTNIFEGLKTVRIYNLLARGKSFAEIPVHESVLPIVEGVLDRGCLVSSLSSISIGPGEGAQPIHADDQLIPLPKPHTSIICNTMWALTDFTAANGATRLISGSHRAATSPEIGTAGSSVTSIAAVPSTSSTRRGPGRSSAFRT
jgi:hypothetical protein